MATQSPHGVHLPFAESGTATPQLQGYIQDANPHNIKVVGNNVIQCNGMTRCLRPIDEGKPSIENYGISALRDTKARCARTSFPEEDASADEGDPTFLERYTGRCQPTDDDASWFLVECKKNANDYILIKYAKDFSEFQTHGNAKALFSKHPNVKAEQLQSGDRKSIVCQKDIYFSCPS